MNDLVSQFIASSTILAMVSFLCVRFPSNSDEFFGPEPWRTAHCPTVEALPAGCEHVPHLHGAETRRTQPIADHASRGLMNSRFSVVLKPLKIKLSPESTNSNRQMAHVWAIRDDQTAIHEEPGVLPQQISGIINQVEQTSDEQDVKSLTREAKGNGP